MGISPVPAIGGCTVCSARKALGAGSGMGSPDQLARLIPPAMESSVEIDPPKCVARITKSKGPGTQHIVIEHNNHHARMRAGDVLFGIIGSPGSEIVGTCGVRSLGFVNSYTCWRVSHQDQHDDFNRKPDMPLAVILLAF